MNVQECRDCEGIHDHFVDRRATRKVVLYNSPRAQVGPLPDSEKMQENKLALFVQVVSKMCFQVHTIKFPATEAGICPAARSG